MLARKIRGEQVATPFHDWKSKLLRDRGLDAPDGRPLYDYRLEEAEFSSLSSLESLLKELEFTEGRATGIPKIMEAMEKNGSPPAEFEFDEDHSYFMVRLPIHPAALEVAMSGPCQEQAAKVGAGETSTQSRSESRSESEPVWRRRPEWRPEWRPESVHDRVMAAICDTPKGRAEIAAVLGHKSITGALRQAIGDLMALGLVEYTLPEKPNSRLPEFRTERAGLVVENFDSLHKTSDSSHKCSMT